MQEDMQSIKTALANSTTTRNPQRMEKIDTSFASPLDSSTRQAFNNRAPLPMRAGPSSSSQERAIVPAPLIGDFTMLFKQQALTALPKFSGAPKEWPKFKRIYLESTQ